ncbi:uncharacterized protein LOC108033529 [Drosophila biarmipes]|uniref:uncharacterized protein LOC108033529 n=1 Tax=Drosophila biarmipes TaxID=125945 RepID=UPI0007E89C4D|nr:uncharacterized protein LOC108033529 [Drosophila biarmipes]
MCFNELEGRSLLPDCHIANRVFLYTFLHSLQEEDRRPEDVDVEFRDRYTVFREVLPNFPVPQHGIPRIQAYIEQVQNTGSTNPNSSGRETSDSSLDSDPHQGATSANGMD